MSTISARKVSVASGVEDTRRSAEIGSTVARKTDSWLIVSTGGARDLTGKHTDSISIRREAWNAGGAYSRAAGLALVWTRDTG